MKDKNSQEMTFLEHLEELRWHLIRSAVVIIIFTAVAFVYKRIVFDVIVLGPSTPEFFTNDLLCRFGHWLHEIWIDLGRTPQNPDVLCINSKPFDLVNYDMAGQFLTHIKISLIAGLILGFPYLTFEFWRFISPALYAKEKKYARGSVFIITFLFILGVLFGYYVISPLSVNFLINYKVSETVENLPRLMSYISVVATISLAAGLLFELPAIIFFLSKVGIVTPEFLRKYRRHSLVIMLIISAIITPPDIFSQILVCLPLIVLYEISIKVSKHINKKVETEL